MDCPQCRSSNAPGTDVCFSCGRPLGVQGLRQGALIAARYELLEPLGSGGMGVVFKAHDRTLDETVAIKVLRPEVAGQEDMARRFQSEIKLARKVRHANVCAIHEYGEDGELRFITMEFIAGEDLRKLLAREGALPPERAYELALQLTTGLQAIHAAGIVHRDLKTPNIMLDAQGAAHLMDFGIAKRVDQQGTTSAGMVAGTPEYMSPEQARGEAVDFRTDIYGLGIVIFELFAGRVPFRGETPVATIFKHLQEAPPLSGVGAPRLPPALVPVLAKALAKQPSQRFQNTAELLLGLTQARQGTLPAQAPGQPTGAFWTCPSCKRHVPSRLVLCRCGKERPAPALPVAASGGSLAPADRAKRPRNVAGLAGGALAAVALVAGATWVLTRSGAARPPAARVTPAAQSSSQPREDPTASPSGEPQNAVAGGEPAAAPSAAASPTAALSPSAPPATPVPSPGPSASPSPVAPGEEATRVPSDIDRLREEGTRQFDESFATLSRRVAEWHATRARCYGVGNPAPGSPLSSTTTVSSCTTTNQELINVGTALVEAIARAEEDARRAWIPPGTQRSIRQKHGLDQDAAERLKSEVRSLEPR